MNDKGNILIGNTDKQRKSGLKICTFWRAKEYKQNLKSIPYIGIFWNPKPVKYRVMTHYYLREKSLRKMSSKNYYDGEIELSLQKSPAIFLAVKYRRF